MTSTTSRTTGPRSPVSDNLLAATLAHLKALVAFDTRNPPRAIDAGGIFDYLRGQLPGFDVTVTDHGAGAVSLLAVRGTPRLLFNVHLDTVPDSPGWTRNPHDLEVTSDRAIGLGACDIKGAAAALLAVANTSDGNLALLFSTDEEANDARCIKTFLETHPASRLPSPESRVPTFTGIVVAEPTRARAVLAHRGIQSVRMEFTGRVGHTSALQAPGDSAVHQAMQWGHTALAFVDGLADRQFGGLSGLRFNVGRIEGGIKANMIAPRCELKFNMRPLPDMDADRLLESFHAMALPGTRLEETFRGPPLPAGDPAKAELRRQEAAALAADLGLPPGAAVDFWTEAAKFSAAGYPTFVYGPGDIAQAHTADEWVALDQLEAYVTAVAAAVEKGRT